jgi:hypothetical protein
MITSPTHLYLVREHGSATTKQIRPLTAHPLLNLIQLFSYPIPLRTDAIRANMYIPQPIVIIPKVFIVIRHLR